MTQNDTNKPVCPHCHATHTPAAACVRAAAPTTLLAQAELLFESYLAARLVRARRNLTKAKVEFLRDPRNPERHDALVRAESEAQRLHTQLLDQARRAARLREHASAASAQPTEEFRTLQAAKADGQHRSTVVPLERNEPNAGAEPFLTEDDVAALRRTKTTD